MQHLHFSGAGHSDMVEIVVHDDKRVEVSCWNDGYPNRMGGGGYSRFLPDSLARHYNEKEFINWLTANFWNGVPIWVFKPAEEHVVKEFLDNALKEDA